jgi:hypothetical protein
MKANVGSLPAPHSNPGAETKAENALTPALQSDPASGLKSRRE